MHPSSAGQIPLNGLIAGGSGASIPTKSFLEEKFSSTVEQHYDFSCGSAALATLLTYSYDRPTTEQQVFAEMFKNGNKKLIEEAGFSLLDMKNYLERHGYMAEGFRAPLEKLEDVSLPAIVLINQDGYNHFVVIRGFRNGKIILSDPAVGMRSEKTQKFKKQWSGIFFIIITDVKTAQKIFNNDKTLKSVPDSPLKIARYAVTLATLQQVNILNSRSF